MLAPKPALRYRLPNPASALVGRDDEITWLREALKQRPLIRVEGAPGVGKTALVLGVLHRWFKKRVARTWYTRVVLETDGRQLRLDLLRMLLAGREDAQAILEELRTADPETLLERALDLAEEGRRLVVIDDAHEAEREELVELMLQLHRYARESRWVVIGRELASAPELLVCTLHLGRLDEAALAALGEGAATELGSAVSKPELTRFARDAGGSPWLMLQLVSGRRASDALLGGLAPNERALIDLLAGLRVALPGTLAAELMHLPDPSRVEALRRRGLLATRGDDHLELPVVVRGALEHESPDVDHRSRLVELLLRQSDAELAIEGARLALLLGRADAVEELLERRAQGWLSGGHAPRIWQLVRAVRGDTFDRVRLRAAAELGNPTAIESAHEPEDRSPRARLDWARVQLARGEPKRARELARNVVFGAAELADEAHELAARCSVLLAEPGTAMDALALLEKDRSPGLRAWARWLDDSTEQTVIAGSDADIHDLGRRDLARDGALRGSEVRRRLEELAVGDPSLLLTRKARVSIARDDLAGLRTEAALSSVRGLRRYARGASGLRPWLDQLELAVAAAREPTHELLPLSEAAYRRARRADHECAEAIGEIQVELALALDADLEPAVAREGGAFFFRRSLLALRDGDVGWVKQQLEAAPRGAPAAIQRARVGAAVGLVESDPIRAAAIAEDAIRLAERASLRRERPVLVALFCDALLAAGRAHDHAREVAELMRLSEELGSAFWRDVAEFHRAADDPATLERLAAHAAPLLARRARALLGDGSAASWVERAILDRIRERAGHRTPTTLPGSSGRAWGIDVERRAVWLDDGRWIEFGGRTSWFGVLAALAVAGGRLKKEALFRAVWPGESYHPLKHDTRIHVTVRKLRELIEEDPGSPMRVVTVDAGYALGGTVRQLA